MKKLFLSVFILLQAVGMANASELSTYQKPEKSLPTEIEIFSRDKCAHCIDLKHFIDELILNYSDIEVVYYNISQKENKQKFDDVTDKVQMSKITPIIYVWNTFIEWFRDSKTTGERIKQLLNKPLSNPLTMDEYIHSEAVNVEKVAGGTCSLVDDVCSASDDSTFIFDIPFMWTVNLKNLSLPFMSSVLGLIDGFNPCAMWVLIMFLIVLTQIWDKRKMYYIVSIFILAEAIMYYLILNVWMTTWDFVWFDEIVTPIVWIIAIWWWIFFLWEWKQNDGTCKVTNQKQRQKIQNKIKDLASQPWTWITFLAVLWLAFSVNIIEFACSIWIPQAFTKVLNLNGLSWLIKQVYMSVYIFFYMLDDIIVFWVAIYSFEKIGIMTKYSKMANLIWGLLMLAIWLLMILKPELLIF